MAYRLLGLFGHVCFVIQNSKHQSGFALTPVELDGMKANWKDFWINALIRAVKTFCQTAVATIGTTALITDVNWLVVASSSALSFVLSILTSLSTNIPEAPCPTEKEQ